MTVKQPPWDQGPWSVGWIKDKKVKRAGGLQVEDTIYRKQGQGNAVCLKSLK